MFKKFNSILNKTNNLKNNIFYLKKRNILFKVSTIILPGISYIYIGNLFIKINIHKNLTGYIYKMFLSSKKPFLYPKNFKKKNIIKR